MATTKLTKGPYLRTEIDDHVAKGKSIGVYVLGPINPNTKCQSIHYVGRSDHNDDGLNGRLHDHDGKWLCCTHFKFDYFGTAKEAFERESWIYHDFDPHHNTIHPPRPAGKKYKCPFSDECFEGDQDED